MSRRNADPLAKQLSGLLAIHSGAFVRNVPVERLNCLGSVDDLQRGPFRTQLGCVAQIEQIPSGERLPVCRLIDQGCGANLHQLLRGYCYGRF